MPERSAFKTKTGASAGERSSPVTRHILVRLRAFLAWLGVSRDGPSSHFLERRWKWKAPAALAARMSHQASVELPTT